MFNLAVSADVITAGQAPTLNGRRERNHEALCYTETTKSESNSSAVNLSLFNCPGDEIECRINLPGERGCHVIYFGIGDLRVWARLFLRLPGPIIIVCQ